MDTEIGKQKVNWDLPLMTREGRSVELIPGNFKFSGGETRLVIWQGSEGYNNTARYFESGSYFPGEGSQDRRDIINIPPTTQEAWVVKYADGSKRVLMTEPEVALRNNPKIIKATLTYYDTP